MSIVRIPSFFATYSPVLASTSPYLASNDSAGARKSSNRTQALSRSLPVVFKPISPTVIPRARRPNAPSRIVTKNPCGPKDRPFTNKFATTTAASAVNPCEIQFFVPPSPSPLLITYPPVFPSQSARVCTTNPLFTPASRSVKQKHPSVPRRRSVSNRARCASVPSAAHVPANRLYCTVNRIQNPGPSVVACVASARCAAKNRAGSSSTSVNVSAPRRETSARSAFAVRRVARFGAFASALATACTSAWSSRVIVRRRATANRSQRPTDRAPGCFRVDAFFIAR